MVKAELFPTQVRATGVGLPYAVTVSIFGGTAESIALWFKSIGHETWFYYYLTAVIATSLLVYVTMRDTKHQIRRWADTNEVRGERSACDGAEECRQVGARVLENFGNGLPIAARERPIRSGGVRARQDIPQTSVDRLPGSCGQRVERVRIDHVAAGISEQPRLQIELPERSPLPVLRSSRRETFGEPRAAFDGAGQGCFVDEQHVVDEFAHDVVDAVVCGWCGRRSRRPGRG